MKLADGWVTGIGNPLVELSKVGSFEYVHGDEHLGGLGGKLDLCEAGMAGVVRGDVSKGNNMAWSGRKSSGLGIRKQRFKSHLCPALVGLLCLTVSVY